MTKRGLYIIIEGIDGAGKDTQGQFLQQYLGEENYVYTKDISHIFKSFHT